MRYHQWRAQGPMGWQPPGIYIVGRHPTKTLVLKDIYGVTQNKLLALGIYPNLYIVLWAPWLKLNFTGARFHNIPEQTLNIFY